MSVQADDCVLLHPQAVKPDRGVCLFWRSLLGTAVMLAFSYLGVQRVTTHGVVLQWFGQRWFHVARALWPVRLDRLQRA